MAISRMHHCVSPPSIQKQIVLDAVIIIDQHPRIAPRAIADQSLKLKLHHRDLLCHVFDLFLVLRYLRTRYLELITTTLIKLLSYRLVFFVLVHCTNAEICAAPKLLFEITSFNFL